MQAVTAVASVPTPVTVLAPALLEGEIRPVDQLVLAAFDLEGISHLLGSPPSLQGRGRRLLC
jgi:hypothetical protein